MSGIELISSFAHHPRAMSEGKIGAPGSHADCRVQKWRGVTPERKADQMFQSHSYCVAFSALIREHWSELKAFTSSERFERGAVIFAVGDPPDAMYLIESGRVKVSRLSHEGEEKITGIYQKGDVIGEVCLCKKGPREDQAAALEASEVASFRVKELLRLLQGKPEMVFNLLMIFCARVAECHEQVSSLAFDNVRERLVQEMFRLSGLRPGEPKRGPVPLPVRLTHRELASLANTTRDNVTRIMNEFRKNGMVDYDREAILIFPKRLEDYLRERHS
jgi:CRP/FNR family transcriptional regulator, cyclic AMP receptor protein